MKLKLRISLDDHGVPAYEVLSRRMNMSGLIIKKIRLYGRLLVNGVASRMKDPVFEGDSIEAILDDERSPASRPDCGIQIYYEDDWVIVCEKPADLVTHPSWQHMDDSLIQRLSDVRLHPVIRLDRDTTGVIVVAKNGYAHNQITERTMHKEYIGIVHGCFSPTSGVIDLPTGRSDTSIITRIVREDGKKSITRYNTLLVNDDIDISMVRFILETGRCHQIRVHSCHLGHPIVGDGLYGPLSRDFPDPDPILRSRDERIERQALHASVLSFIHPVTQECMIFHSALPADMLRLITDRGGQTRH
ncbi:MAG: RluA family pseudouridine synthase [Clostridiales bacterium]|nr:RluA family pseudouridine synthase [Clostridiales bacterium]